MSSGTPERSLSSANVTSLSGVKTFDPASSRNRRETDPPRSRSARPWSSSPARLQGSNDLHTAQVGVAVPDVGIGGKDAELRQPRDIDRLHTGTVGCRLE